VWTSTTKHKTIYNKAARRRQLNLKSYWTIQCNRMLKYNIMKWIVVYSDSNYSPVCPPCNLTCCLQTLYLLSNMAPTAPDFKVTVPCLVATVCALFLVESDDWYWRGVAVLWWRGSLVIHGLLFPYWSLLILEVRLLLLLSLSKHYR
jgi:hypothetical protein